ncbi:MAG: 2-oxo acid dehydrogenase subunit E2 [Deltaproteobacteria bacterium]|nr:2-oxo acid dehydrogenase subunit E2 [Deltaproteobacteria bacterium]
MATEVVIPMLGVTIETGIIVEWLKKEGDQVKKGESLFVVEADKVVAEVESPASGLLAKILLPVGQKVPVLTVVAVITDPGESVPARYLSGAPAAAAAERMPSPVAAVPMTAPTALPAPGPVRAVPAARTLAREKGMDLSGIKGSGPAGVILHKDVAEAAAAPSVVVSHLARQASEKAGLPLGAIPGSGVRGRVMQADVARAAAEAAAPRLGKIIPMDRMRRIIARRMAESAFTAPHIHFFSDVGMDALLAFRGQILPEFETRLGLRPSVNDFLIKAAALAIRDYPLLNAIVKGEEIHILPEINVCLAVALPDGLITPAVSNADQCGLAEIVRLRADLVRRARAGALTVAELERGTFTISSLAQYDISHFTAILNPPQSAILSVGKTRDTIYLENGQVRSARMATLGLSVDHRIIDGTLAAEFLQTLKAYLEKPAFTFLHV